MASASIPRSRHNRQLGAARLGAARLGAARLGAARLGAASVVAAALVGLIGAGAALAWGSQALLADLTSDPSTRPQDLAAAEAVAVAAAAAAWVVLLRLTLAVALGGAAVLAAASAPRVAQRLARAAARCAPRMLRGLLVGGLSGLVVGLAVLPARAAPPSVDAALTSTPALVDEAGDEQEDAAGQDGSEDRPWPDLDRPAWPVRGPDAENRRPGTSGPEESMSEPPAATSGQQERPDRYVVRPGDSLWSIAAAHLPRAQRTDRAVAESWPRWWRANRAVVGPDPALLTPGQVLQVPAAARR